MAKHSSKNAPRLAVAEPTQAIDSGTPSFPQCEEVLTDPQQLILLMELCLINATSQFAASWDSDGQSDRPRDFLEAILGDDAKPPSSEFAEVAEHLRCAFRSLKAFQSAVAQQNWVEACRYSFECGLMLMAGKRAFGIRAEVAGMKAMYSRLNATWSNERTAHIRHAAAKAELLRRLEDNPKLTKTSALKAMAKERKYGSLRMLQTALKDVNRSQSNQ